MSDLDRTSAETLDELAGHLAAGEIIAFVGAGASAERALTWAGLIKRMAAGIEGWDSVARNTLQWIASANPQYAAELISKQLTQAERLKILKKEFRWPSGIYTEIQAALAALPFKGYVTTNYDPGLKHAIQDAARGREIDIASHRNLTKLAAWSDASVFRSNAVPLLHIHGDIEDPAHVVFDRNSYSAAYGEEHGLDQLLSDLWRATRLFFVGYGFSDPWLNFLCQQITLRVNLRAPADGHRHFALVGIDPRRSAPRLVRRYYKEVFDVDPIIYPVQRLANGREDHRAALTTLHDLMGRCRGGNFASADHDGRRQGETGKSIRYVLMPESTPAEIRRAQTATAERFGCPVWPRLDVHGDTLEFAVVPPGRYRSGAREHQIKSPFLLSRHLVPCAIVRRWHSAGCDMDQTAAALCVEQLAHHLDLPLSLPTELQWDLALGDGRGEVLGFEFTNSLEILADGYPGPRLTGGRPGAAGIGDPGHYWVKRSGDLSTRPLHLAARFKYTVGEGLKPPAFRVAMDLSGQLPLGTNRA